MVALRPQRKPRLLMCAQLVSVRPKFKHCMEKQRQQAGENMWRFLLLLFALTVAVGMLTVRTLYRRWRSARRRYRWERGRVRRERRRGRNRRRKEPEAVHEAALVAAGGECIYDEEAHPQHP